MLPVGPGRRKSMWTRQPRARSRFPTNNHPQPSLDQPCPISSMHPCVLKTTTSLALISLQPHNHGWVTSTTAIFLSQKEEQRASYLSSCTAIIFHHAQTLSFIIHRLYLSSYTGVIFHHAQPLSFTTQSRFCLRPRICSDGYVAHTPVPSGSGAFENVRTTDNHKLHYTAVTVSHTPKALQSLIQGQPTHGVDKVPLYQN
jgi:hypothetical protein